MDAFSKWHRKKFGIKNKLFYRDEFKECWEASIKNKEAQNTPTNKPSAEISALIAELYSNKPADRIYSREEVIMYLKRAETSHVG